MKQQKPLRVNCAYTSASGAKLGLCQAPGKQIQKGRDGKAHNRDLFTDVRQFKDKGVQIIICLLNEAELRTLGIDAFQYHNICERLGVILYIFPIIEMGIPENFQQFQELLQTIHGHLTNNQSVLVHCRGGIGRTGLLAACYICAVGQYTDGNQAIAHIRRIRDRRCVESRRQEDFVRNFCRNCSGSLG